jgi:cobalt/nickel transport system permease protein
MRSLRNHPSNLYFDMHIPDGFLSPSVWGTFDVASGSLLTIGLQQVGQRMEERAVPLMGVLAAFVFAAQMVNLPIAGGVSGHFLGGALVGILLGPWSGLVLMSTVLVVQCFLLQDGGAAALGANIWNMGFLGSFVAYGVARGIRRFAQTPRGLFWSGFLAAWSTIVLSSLSCASMLSISKVVSWRLSLSVLGGVHAALGLLEGMATGTVLVSISKIRPDLLERPKI